MLKKKFVTRHLNQNIRIMYTSSSEIFNSKNLFLFRSVSVQFTRSNLLNQHIHSNDEMTVSTESLDLVG
jgi:hypothetical protein